MPRPADGRTPQLSPAYDFVSTLPYLPDGRHALSFGGSRALGRMTDDQLVRFADTAGLPVHPVVETVRETVARTVAAWRELPKKEVLPDGVREVVGEWVSFVP